MTEIKTSSYIKDIDGLRALAVLAVLLFHTFPTLTPGGYIGVDIFFVISGFVISRSYLINLIERKTTLSNFYVRRVRRLAPSYIVVVAFSFLFSYVILEPKLLVNFSNSLLAQPFYVQNFVFWAEGDYFDNAYTKPLLHTWSLAVEEQFYIFFGVLILVLRKKIEMLAPLFLLILLASYLLGYLISDSSPKTSFFLLPTRMWEFLVGIIAFLITRKINVRNEGPLINAIYILCVISLLCSIFAFGSEDVFPGLQSLLASVPTFILLILFEKSQGKTYRIFGQQHLCYIGKISYSLYLWHWPIISFLVMYFDRRLYWYEAVAVIAISFVLSAFTYEYVENPIRRKKILRSTRELFKWGAFSAALVVVISLVLVYTHGALFRYSDPDVRALFLAAQERTPYRCSKLFRITNPRSEMCRVNAVKEGPGVLIIGDSHADRLDEMIAELGDKRGVPVYLAVRNCDFDQFGSRSHCNMSVLNKILQEIKNNDINTIIATSYWGPTNLKYKMFQDQLDIFVNAGLKVYFSEVVPHAKYFNPSTRAMVLINESPLPEPYTAADYANDVKIQATIFERLADQYPGYVKVLNPSKYLCDSVDCDFYTDGYPNYFDDSHLTKVGINRLRPMYDNVILATSRGG